MSTPLRCVLRYDPVFLELGRRLACGEWGRVGGVSVSAVIESAEKERDLLAFLILLFGRPTSAVRTAAPPLFRSILMYGTFALSAECVVAGEVLCYGRGAAVSGSLSCSSAVVEFRLGADRFLAAARDESRAYRVSMAEGDGERYRRMDEAAVGGPAVVGIEKDAEALAFVDGLVAAGTMR